ncbi:hypothetical protein BDV33DRAFT_182222 [Aspergillus novoparasiticus]|uniref:Uncharacterized protein n=1 Tax=Aspergillus novoparasiticus TaxID=986946 RepID=A0A5N6EAW7_9EURO|nr:hypothetical protein BDV33DRAFT_182222 [Aspergillus novoparasiticus]
MTRQHENNKTDLPPSPNTSTIIEKPPTKSEVDKVPQNQEHQPVDRLGPTLPFRCDHMTRATKMHSPPRKPPDRVEKVHKYPPPGKHTDT